jgi:integrase
MPKLTDTHIPSYCRHRGSGQAYVQLDGRDFYLGKHGTKESRDAYDRKIAEWIAAGRRLPVDPLAILVMEVVNAFRKHAETYYRHQDGTPTGEATTFAAALRPLLKLYARTPALEFGPLKLKAVRNAMIETGWVRSAINKQVARIRHVFKWAAENELLPASVYHGLAAVSGLRLGRSDAEESDGVEPVELSDVEAVLHHVSRQVGAMIRLQLACGCRPGEAVIMRTGDIDRTGPLWVFRPRQWKTKHLGTGHAREIYLGPRAQEIVTPFLRLDPNAFIFDPRQAEEERRERQHAGRVTPINHGNRPGTNRQSRPKRQACERYTVASYRRAIERGCDAAFPPPAHLCPRTWVEGDKARHETEAAFYARLTDAERVELKQWRTSRRWSPHQLRHRAGTELRKTHGIEAAQCILGHKTLSVTEIYAAKNVEAAKQIMAQVG